MQHVSKRALLAGAIELKGEEDDPVSIVTKAVADLTKTVDDRLKAVETKGLDPKLVERLDKIEAKVNRPGTDKDAPHEPSIERKAFGTYLRFGAAAPAEEMKVLTVSSDPQGGYLAPKEVSTEMIRDLVQYSPIRPLASVRSAVGPSQTYPRRTGITNAAWKGEVQASTGSEPTFGQTEIPIREVNTHVDISNQLLADSGGEVEAEVRLALAEDFGQKEALAFIDGDGVVAPEGLLTNAEIGWTPSHSGTGITADSLVDAYYALPAAYRATGTWIMSGTTLAAIRKLKEAVTGQYLWVPGLGGSPETILNRPVVEAIDMPEVEAGAFPIIFGDFTGYRIVDRISLSILPNPFLLATSGITRYHATRRVGGGVLEPKKFRKVKVDAA